MIEIERRELPSLCQTCIHKIETSTSKLYEELCRVYKRKIPLSVSQDNSCDYYPDKEFKREKKLSSFLPIDYFSPLQFPVNDVKRRAIMPWDRRFQINRDAQVVRLRNLLTHLDKSFVGDPKSSELMKSLLSDVEKLKEKVELQNEEINKSLRSVDEIFQELEKTVGEDRVEEVIGSFLTNFPQPSFLDWKTHFNRVNNCEENITNLNQSAVTIQVQLNNIATRLEKVEGKVNLAKNIRWLISILGTAIVAGISGWVLHYFLR